MDVKIDESWKEALHAEFKKAYFEQIAAFLKTEKAQGKIIYPPGSLIFNAFNTTPFQQGKSGDHRARILIMAQDRQWALVSSVPKGVKPPPSLVNIFKELHTDIGMQMPTTGDLTPWATQGVLLLNAALTVRSQEANSHAKIGWHQFTDAAIQKLSDEKQGIVFLLWGSFAQQKQELIDETKHHVLKAAHPSPFSAHAGFFGCKHFSKTNEFLSQENKEAIDWQLP